MAVSVVGNFPSLDGVNASLACVFLAVAVAAFIRSIFIGVKVGEAGVRLVSWFQTRTFRWSELRRSDAVPYYGLWSKGAETRLISMIQVTLANNVALKVYGTMGAPRATIRRAKILNDMIAERIEQLP
ncbi:PH domain-containing protein [Homoserinibacter sp. GY 40078]|uniref:PH domain-containing protein n=1 Tax=Homoserinibacter sp. GY 40078 TaxID=2603275 RepID=UPI001C9CB9E8|nr:PH domain-containing protein [Homoserinibacter sp. GY 40078]